MSHLCQPNQCLIVAREQCRHPREGPHTGHTPHEWAPKIVVQLVSRKGRPQTYRAIYDTAHYEGFIAGSGGDGHHSNVRSLVKRIRKKFLAIDPGFSEIENLAGVGYRWAGPKL